MYHPRRLLLFLIVGLLLCVAPAYAQSFFWNHNGSMVELVSDGAIREFHYWQPRPGLPVTMGTVLFRGTANGNRYSGTAYVFSRVCGAIGYNVSGTVAVDQKSITLYGKAPFVNSNCNVLGYRDDMLVFSFNGCGCECGHEPELFALVPPPRYTESTSASEGHSCPYLYAWSDQVSRWQSYGKVIRDARGQSQEMTQVIKLTSFGTKFRLAEEESERSFIDQVQLRIELKEGSQVILKPVTKILAERDGRRLYIPAFKMAEFAFELPVWIKPADVEQTSLSITGYYERLPFPPICRPPIAVSGN
jgi:hypothetical protein